MSSKSISLDEDFGSFSEGTKLYQEDSKGWKHYKVDKLDYKQCKMVMEKCHGETRCDRWKSFGWTALGVAASLILVAVSFTVTRIALLLLAILFSPLAAPILPLYLVICIAGALTAGSAFGYFTIKAIWDRISPEIKQNWNAADHYEIQADQCHDRLIQLSGKGKA